MSRITLFLQLSVGLILTVTGKLDSCPIVLSPSSVVVRYGDSVSVNCSTTVSHEGMGWEASKGGTNTQQVNHLSWTVASLTEWEASPLCFINLQDEQCSKNLDVIVYTFPETIKINSSSGANGEMTEGKNYTITCDIPSVAPVKSLTVKWYKEDTIIKTDTFENKDTNPVNLSSHLSVIPTRQDNSARFRCEAHMDLSPVGPRLHVSSQEYNVTVFFGADLQCSTSDVIELLEKESLEGKCTVTGNPTPRVRWLKDGQPFSISSPMRRSDAGIYTVKAEGFSSVQKNIEVHVLYGPEVMCPSTHTAEEFVPYRLNCTFEGYPKPEIAWYKDEEEVKRLSPTQEMILSRNDAGQYLIAFSNSLSSVNFTLDIVVQYPPSQISGLQDNEVNVGSTVMLKCASTGNPQPKYRWNYYQTANVMEKNIDGVSHLVIHNANAYNIGSYTCHAWNNKGNISKTARVTVKGVTPECPIDIKPDKMVIEYRSKGRNATCNSNSTIVSNGIGIGWNKTNETTWTVGPNLQWDSTLVCTGNFQGIGECSKSLNLILYQQPYNISISRNESLRMINGTEVQLECTIFDVAPAQILTVVWYINNKTTSQGSLQIIDCKTENCNISAVRSPVTVRSTINITLNEEHKEFKCEAQLNVEKQFLLSKTSDSLNISVLYKPTINTTKLPHKIPVFSGYPEELVCEADGYPSPNISWVHKEKLFNTSILIVSEEGIYICKAESDAGSTVHVVEVILKEDYLPLIAGFVAVTVVAISIIFVFIYSIYYKNTKMRHYSLQNPKLRPFNGNVAHNGGDLQFPMTRLSKQYICA